MTKKFLSLLIWGLLLMPSLIVKAQSKDDLIMSVVIDDTIYYGQRVQVMVLIETEKLFPKFFMMNKYVVPSKQSFNYEGHCVFLELNHNGILYEEVSPGIIIHGEEKKVWVSKWHPLKLYGVFYFDKLLPNGCFNADSDVLSVIRNTDFGEYKLRSAFITHESDTIYSKPLTIHYLRK